LIQLLPEHEIWVASLDGGLVQRVLEEPSDSKAIYVPPVVSGEDTGWLLFVRQATLHAQRFNADTLRTEGEARRVAGDVRVNAKNGRAAFTVSENGVLVYRTGELSFYRTLKWLTADGMPFKTTAAATERYMQIALLKGDQSIIAAVADEYFTHFELRKIDLARGTSETLTTDLESDNSMVVSHDGSQIAWRTKRAGVPQIVRRPAARGGRDQLWIPTDARPLHWSEKFLIFGAPGDGTRMLRHQATGEDTSQKFMRAAIRAALSPDEKWIAYQFNDGNGPDVYLRPFPGSAATLDEKVSGPEGGVAPRFREDGREIVYFVPPDRRSRPDDATRVMRVAVASGHAQSSPVKLFDLPEGTGANNVVMSADGQHFLIAARPPAIYAPMTVLINWMSKLQDK
jgi:hypothetical protein